MILINKDEKKAIQEELPWLNIARTVHHYYMEERPEAMRMLRKLRGQTGKRGRR